MSLFKVIKMRYKRKTCGNQLTTIISLGVLCSLFFLGSCESHKIETINMGYVGPLTTRATDLGIAPANAMILAVEQYNGSRKNNEPMVNLFIEDDQWQKANALPAYQKLRREHNIDVLFISNSDGTVAIQDQIKEDNVIVVNPLNSDALLSNMNRNTFKIAKTTEEANGLIAIRIIELGLKKVLVMHYPNDFMSRAAGAVKTYLDEEGIENHIVTTDTNQTDFNKILQSHKEADYDAYVFFGYKEYGFAMKQARDMGIIAPFFGSTVLLDPEFYDNSEGTIVGTECPFFTGTDGNYILAKEFFEAYNSKFDDLPTSVWPPMQAYDAINLILSQIRTVNASKDKNEPFGDWLRSNLFNVNYYQGICGNLSISEDGSSKGIYFSLYRYDSKGKLLKVNQ